MPDWIITWLRTASWRDVFAVFLIENLAILLLVVILGGWIAALYNDRKVSLRPGPISLTEVVVALVNVLLNTATTLAGLCLWRRGVITFRTDVGLLALADVVVLLLSMDLLMYLLHRIAHTRILFKWLHQFHHRYDRPRPLTLFALSPIENLAFGGLWLTVISVYDASWLGMSVYLILNVMFGTIGHLGVELFPSGWARVPILRNLAGGSFHTQHHQDIGHNFGFYTLIWDRLFGTIRSDYERNYGKLPGWVAD